jgi:hypothetical protein
MRVGSDKQTLILAGEAVPPRDIDDQSAHRAQIQRVTTVLVVQEEFGTGIGASNLRPSQPFPTAHSKGALSVSRDEDEDDSPSLPAPYVRSRPSSGRTTGAAEYVRTQSLFGVAARTQLIDIYA